MLIEKWTNTNQTLKGILYSYIQYCQSNTPLHVIPNLCVTARFYTIKVNSDQGLSSFINVKKHHKTYESCALVSRRHSIALCDEHSRYTLIVSFASDLVLVHIVFSNVSLVPNLKMHEICELFKLEFGL